MAENHGLLGSLEMLWAPISGTGFAGVLPLAQASQKPLFLDRFQSKDTIQMLRLRALLPQDLSPEGRQQKEAVP